MSTEDLSFTLNTGDKIPLVGFGTRAIQGKITVDVLDSALEAGYRLFDTSAMNDNEGDIGKALKILLPKHNLSREDVFIITKLRPEDQGEKAYKALKKSLVKLDMDYIDLYLINWPGDMSPLIMMSVPVQYEPI